MARLHDPISVDDANIENLPALVATLESTRARFHDVSKQLRGDCPVTGRQKLTCEGSSCDCKSKDAEWNSLRDEMNRLNKFVKTARLLRGDISFNSRGIGLNSRECFVCGKKNETGSNHNIAAYVQSKNDGDTIVDWFDGKGAWTDFRVREPDYIQVKIHACDEHLPLLEELNESTMNGGAICKDDVASIIKKGRAPGITTKT